MSDAPTPRVSYRSVTPTLYKDEANPVRRLAEVLANAMLGKLNIGGSGIANGTSSTITDSRIGSQSVILFMPTTQQGAGLNIWVTSRGNGVAQISHQNATDEPFDYIIIG